MRLRELIDQVSDRLADSGPVRLLIIARPHQRVLHGAQPQRVGKLWQSCAREQGPQRRIGERRAIKCPQMWITLAGPPQQGVAQVVQRWPVLAGNERLRSGAEKITCLQVTIASYSAGTGMSCGRAE